MSDKLFSGPVIPGSLWFLRRFGFASEEAVHSNPPIPIPSYEPEINFLNGPPIPGSPWYRPVQDELSSLAPGSDPNPPPQPSLPSRSVGNFLPLIRRDPRLPAILRGFTEEVANRLNALVRAGILFQTGPATWEIDLQLTAAEIIALFSTAGPHEFFAGPGPAFRALAESDLPISGASAGTYYLATVTVNQFGIVTAISSGAITDNWTPSGIGPPDATNGSVGSVYFDITDPNDPLFYYRN